jgi:hypothetical protein
LDVRPSRGLRTGATAREAPCGVPRALSWGSAAFRGLRSDRSRPDTGSGRPVRRFDALRVLSDRTSGRPKPSVAPLALFAPLQRSIAAAPHRGEGLAATARCFLSWASLALRHTLGSADPFLDGASRRHPVPRPGFGYPHRGAHRRSYRRSRRRSVPGLLPSRPHACAVESLSRLLPS